MTDAARQVVQAVRRTAEEFADGDRILVACSGGADSLALAAATAEVVRTRRFAGLRAGAVVVDHGLQPDSAEIADTAGAQCRRLGLEPVLVLRIRPDLTAGKGVEAAARDARYPALEQAAHEQGAAAVLLGHTADDQAETVLIGLSRGSGPRALAGMPAVRGIYRRPLLGLRRSLVRAAYPTLPVWHDPANDDPRFTRSRVRNRVLPMLEGELGPGITAALARSAEQVRAEVAAIDTWAEELAAVNVSATPGGTVEVRAAELRHKPAAVLTRIMRAAAQAAGASGGRLSAVHLASLTALIADWHGQGQVDLPGGVIARRISGTVVLGSAVAEP